MSTELKTTDKPMASWKAWGTLAATAAVLLTPIGKGIAVLTASTVFNPGVWVTTAVVGALAYGGAALYDAANPSKDGEPGALERVNGVALGAWAGLKKAASFYKNAFTRAFSDVGIGSKQATSWAEDREAKRQAEGPVEIDLKSGLGGKTLAGFGKVAKDKAAKVVTAANDVAAKAKAQAKGLDS